MKTASLSLVDTNVLVYAADKTSPFHQASKALRDKGFRGEIPLCVFPQILSEFYSTITNPKRVTNARTQAEAMAAMEKYIKAKNIVKLYHNPDVITMMFDLLKKYPVTKQKVFDLQLVASMLANGVNHIYTYNQADFLMFNEINVLSP